MEAFKFLFSKERNPNLVNSQNEFPVGWLCPHLFHLDQWTIKRNRLLTMKMKLKIWLQGPAWAQDQRTEHLETAPGNETFLLLCRCKRILKGATEAHIEGTDLL
jgi:hypothetical protein